MAITAPGVGSGLDINGIVSQLMALERRPLVALQNRESEYKTQLSAYGRLKSAVESFETAMKGLSTQSKFEAYKAISADEDAFTATASWQANIGSFSIKVVELASSHRMASSSVADKDTTTLGASGDTMTLTVNGESFDVDIGGKTLQEIRNAVLDATDNTGVTASILKENDSSYRLILSSEQSGEDYEITTSFTNGGSPIADPLGLSTTVTAKDAEILVDGTFTVKSSSNTFTDSIEGITLTVKSKTDSAVALDIERDTDTIKQSAQAFADAYNALRSTLTDLRANELSSDNTLLTIENRIRDILNTPPSGVTGNYQYLAQVGLELQKDGTMSFTASKLETALADDLGNVAELFANNDQGYAWRLKGAATSILAASGLISARETGINSRIKTNQSQQESLEYRLQLIEERYRAQFNNLDSMMGQLSATSNYLTKQLSMIANI